MSAHRMTDEEFTTVVTLAADGTHIREIAKEIGCSFQTVSRNLTARGWDRKSLVKYRLNTEERLLTLEHENKILNQLLKRVTEGFDE